MKDFAKITRPLHELTRKEQKWEWETKQEKLFEILKKQFTIESILVALNLDRKMKMKVNMSDFATGEVLSMEYADGR